MGSNRHMSHSIDLARNHRDVEVMAEAVVPNVVAAAGSRPRRRTETQWVG